MIEADTFVCNLIFFHRVSPLALIVYMQEISGRMEGLSAEFELGGAAKIWFAS